MIDKTDYTFKRLDADMYEDLVYISKSAFGFDPGVDYYRNKNNTNSFGKSFLGYIAYSQTGEPAAFYGVYACPVEYHQKTFIAAQSGDTMTHRNHTGKGLFTILAKMTYDLAKAEGITFIFGFPNYNSYPGFVKKLSWVCPGKLVEFRQKVITLPVAKIAKKIPLLSKFYKAYVAFVLSFYKSNDKTFRNSTYSSDSISVNRSVDFIKYKSFSGCKIIKLKEQNAWVKLDGFLIIGDIELKEASNIKSINRQIRRLAFFLGSDVIVFQCSPNSYWHDKFITICEPKDAFPFGFLDLDGKLPLEKLSFVLADLDTF